MTGAVDPAVLRALGEDIGTEHAREFAERYRHLLPQRVDRLVTALRAGQVEEARTTALSLHSTSTMVGATTLARTVRELAEALRRTGTTTGHAPGDLEDLAHATLTALAALLLPMAPAAQVVAAAPAAGGPATVH